MLELKAYPCKYLCQTPVATNIYMWLADPGFGGGGGGGVNCHKQGQRPLLEARSGERGMGHGGNQKMLR